MNLKLNELLRATDARLAGFLALVTVVFYQPIYWLVTHATSSDLYSHTILIPFVGLYLFRENLDRLSHSERRPSLALLPLACALFLLWVAYRGGWDPSVVDQRENYLAYTILAYVCFVIAGCCFFAGIDNIKANLFPLGILLLTAPFPTWLYEAITSFFQHTSAEVSYWGIKLIGVPIYRTDLIFEMPTITMEVAPQCSGLRSSLVLFIVSLVASYLFLKSPWKRAVFVSLFIPIGIIRNAIRITVLAWQCYYIDPSMIDGWFHKQGGQPLFAVTLIPLFIVLWLFRRSERKKRAEEN